MDSAATEQMTGANNASAEGNPSSNTGMVLRRMIAAHGSNPPAATGKATGTPSIERAAATALGRAAERLHHLPAFVERVELTPITVPELGELFPERALLTVLEGTRDDLGVMALCPNLLTSIIEMQAIGRVTSRSVPNRRPTRTDATIAADFVNLLLAELGRELGSGVNCPDFAAYRYATYIDDPRPLALMLDDGPMQRLSLHFRVGSGGQRDASILIALPAPNGLGQRQTPRTVDESTPHTAPLPPPAEPQPPIEASLHKAVQAAPIRVVGVLCRRKLSLQTLQALSPGSLIPLPHNSLNEARLETPGGQLLASGRLGESDGFHAIRLKQTAPNAGRQDGGGKPVDSDANMRHAAPGDTAPPPPPVGSERPEPADLDSESDPPIADLHSPDAFRTPEDSADTAPVRGNFG